MIAPCGANCSVCIGHLREKNKCMGCFADDVGKPHHCVVCSRKSCNKKETYCYECIDFPCKKIKTLDDRYKEKYNTSLINNLLDLKKLGLEKFMEVQDKKYRCKNCNSIISYHLKECLVCKEPYEIERNY